MIRTLQRWLRPLERTPLHPQWLVLRHRREISAWIVEHASGTLVDVGCGNGRLRSELSSTVRYIGVDYPTTIALGYAGTADILADAASLPIASGAADVVTLLDVLEHLPDPARAVAEASRILRHGGKCLIHVPFLYPLHDEPYDFQRWTRHGLQRLLSAHELEVEAAESSTSPMESAAALVSIALAQGAVDAMVQRSPAVMLVPFMLTLVPLINVGGWLLAAFLPPSDRMPFSYKLLARKRSSVSGAHGNA